MTPLLPTVTRRPLLLALSALLLAHAPPAFGQAPIGAFAGKTFEVGATAQRVSNAYGDWRGGYARAVVPVGTSDTWWADVLAMEAFTERGVQVGIAQRHDWTRRFFTLVGATVADGAPIFPRVRADLQAGVLLGPARTVVATLGVSHVRSVQTLSDAALVSSLAWYAPHGIILDANVRVNTSWPGRVRTARSGGSATWMLADRSFSVRGIAGEEGYQIISAQTALVRFSSHEVSVAWRERLGQGWSTALQVDRYENPAYTRTGLTLGLARHW